jgi:Mrp family chromosome partitioning ATPase
MLKDGRQVIVVVEPGDNPGIVAQKIAERLMKSGYHVLRLGLGAATEAYRRCMID